MLGEYLQKCGTYSKGSMYGGRSVLRVCVVGGLIGYYTAVAVAPGTSPVKGSGSRGPGLLTCVVGGRAG